MKDDIKIRLENHEVYISPALYRVYGFLVDYMLKHLYSPSIDDIMQGTGLQSKSSVWTALRRLSDKGLIRLGEARQPRTISLIGYRLVNSLSLTQSRK